MSLSSRCRYSNPNPRLGRFLKKFCRKYSFIVTKGSVPSALPARHGRLRAFVVAGAGLPLAHLNYGLKSPSPMKRTYLENLSDADFAAFLTDILTIIATRTKGKATSIRLLPRNNTPSYPGKTMLRMALQLLDPEMWQSLTLNMGPNLRVLECDFEWPVETGRLVNLEYLALERGFTADGTAVAMDLIGKLPKLKYLHFSRVPPRMSTELMSQLKHFQCGNEYPYSPHSPFLFIPAMVNLTRLSFLSGGLGMFDSLTLTNLKTLQIAGWPSGMDGFNLPSLRYLQINTLDCTTFHKASLRRLLPQLTDLSLRHFPPMDGTLVEVLQIIDGIQNLELYDCIVGYHFLKALKSPALAPQMRRLHIMTSVIFPVSLYHELMRARGLVGTYAFCFLSNGGEFEGPTKQYLPKSGPLPEDYNDLPSRFLLSEYYDALYITQTRRDVNNNIFRQGLLLSRWPFTSQDPFLYINTDIEQGDWEARAKDNLYVLVLETHEDIQAILSSAKVGDDQFWARRLKFHKTLSDLAKEQWDQRFAEEDPEDEDESSGQSDDEESG
ncbi:hypothetical protein VNI00_014653 [Paramarasmius palmivorus]|uniref:Uncharacterized protein n=1 Tax=Paramarasmius palmivorus TaxID=297713 RepID=A0AAW0BSM9_9AGAR